MADSGFPEESNTVTGGYYQQNLISEAEYLETQGYSRAAAAGIAGTTAGESAGNPESVGSGGAGLIGWTPPSSASPISDIVTGNDQQDFDNQLTDLLTYANSNSAEAVSRGGVDLATLKAATSPQQAATWWSEFEGPANPGSDVRSGEVTTIYNALNGTPVTDAASTSDSSSGILSFPGQITGFFSDADTFVNALLWIVQPGSWLRIGAFIAGVALLLFAIHALIGVASGGNLFPSVPSGVPIPVPV